MDLLSGIIGLLIGILGLKIRLIMIIIKSILSAFTSYLFLSIENDMELWTFSEYNDASFLQFYNSDIFGLSIVFFVISFVFFYWLIPIVLHKILDGKLKGLIGKIYSGENDEVGKKVIDIIAPFIVKFGIWTTLDIPHKRLVYDGSNPYMKIRSQMVDLLCFVIHLTVCICFSSSATFSAFAIGFAVFFMLNFAMTPFWIFHHQYFSNALITENNKYIDKREHNTDFR